MLAALETRLRRDVYRAAVCAWAALAAAVVIQPAIAHPRAQGIYPILAHGGRAWAAGEDLYRRPRETGLSDRFRYGPPFAALMTPFVALPDRVGAMLWRLGSAVLLFLALDLWARTLLDRPRGDPAVGAFLLLTAPPAVGNLHIAQNNPLVLSLILLGTAAVARRHWNAAALALAAAGFVKGYPLAAGLLAAAAFPLRFGPRFAAAIVVVGALPFLVQHPQYVAEQYALWFEHWTGRDPRRLTAGYLDLRMLLQRCGPTISPGVGFLMSIAVAAAAAAAVHGLRRVGADAVERAVWVTILAGVWMTLLGPATEGLTYLLIAPTAARALLPADRPEDRPNPAAAWAAYALLLAAQAAVWFPFGSTVRSWGIQPAAVLLLAAAYAIVLARRLRRGPEGSAPGSPPGSAAVGGTVVAEDARPAQPGHQGSADGQTREHHGRPHPPVERQE
jgi:hypothetical protein